MAPSVNPTARRLVSATFAVCSVSLLVLLGIHTVSVHRRHTLSSLGQACPGCRAQHRGLRQLDLVHEWPFDGNALVEASLLRGIVLILPACGRSAGDFWSPGPACEVVCRANLTAPGASDLHRLVARAVARSYVVLAVSKQTTEAHVDGFAGANAFADTRHGSGVGAIAAASSSCWDTKSNGDRAQVARAVNTWRDKQAMPRNIPTLVLGMGNGGASLATKLPYVMHISGVAVLHADGPSLQIHDAGPLKGRAEYPPVASDVDIPFSSVPVQVLHEPEVALGRSVVAALPYETLHELQSLGVLDWRGSVIRDPQGLAALEVGEAAKAASDDLVETWQNTLRVDDVANAMLDFFEATATQ